MSMYGLTSCEILDIQAVLLSLLDKTCTITRATLTPDGLGSESESLALIATVACTVDKPSAGQLAEYAGKIGSLASWQVKMPNNTNVQENDTLTIDGQNMIVQAILQPKSYSFLTNCLASEVV